MKQLFRFHPINCRSKIEINPSLSSFRDALRSSIGSHLSANLLKPNDIKCAGTAIANKEIDIGKAIQNAIRRSGEISNVKHGRSVQLCSKNCNGNRTGVDKYGYTSLKKNRLALRTYDI